MSWLAQLLARRKGVLRRDLSFLYGDMHAHLVPGIDDGASTLEEAVQMVEQMSRLGLRVLWLTPHIYAAHYPNTTQGVRAAFEPLQRAVRRRDLPVRLHVAAEYHLDEHFDHLLEQGDLLCLPDRHVLIELPFFAAPHHLERRLFRMQLKGYRPILAHPERYGYWVRDLGRFRRLMDMGCKLQLNLLSLAGAYGPRVSNWAYQLLYSGCIAVLGTDCHRLAHLELLQDWLRKGRCRMPRDATFTYNHNL